jgi:glycosyltransferase involved in cell wall biosynthesis
MGKKSNTGSKTVGPGTKKYYPIVSICTPTFNRRPFIPIMVECFRAQTYPKDRMEWIIVDDGTDKIKDVLDKEAHDLLPLIKYFAVDTKMSLGAKRNFMHTKTKGSIIVYMDDDDYYPPERVEHAVTTLMANKEALCAGSSEMYILFKLDDPHNPTLVSNTNTKKTIKMVQCGPYGPNHATAGTFAFKSRLLDDTRYEDHAALAEEKAFLKNYTIPFVQLDPLKTILVFSHNHNTFDKRKMLEHADPNVIRESQKTVDDFLKTHPKKDKIKQFFMEDIETLLRNYEPGDPKMKPDVLEQTRKIEELRRQMMQQQIQQQQQQPFLQMEHPGKPPVKMTMQQTVEFINQQHQEILALRQRVQELEALGSNHIQHSTTSVKPRREMQGPTEGPNKQKTNNRVVNLNINEKLKSEPEIHIRI